MKELLNFSLINLDKPQGPTSYSISDYVRKSLVLSKTSHMGTLDPKVTGVLPITLGRACKLAAYFIKHDKTYVGILHTHKNQEIKNLQKIINEKFLGKINQTPPHRSSVKRAERQREVYFWNLIETSEEGRDFLFECKVEGGTYIRKLCSDLGELIGGAHMGELRRTKAGIFSEEKIYNLYELDEAVKEYKAGDKTKLEKMIIPAKEAIKEVLNIVEVRKECIKNLHTGKPLFKEDVIISPKLKENQSFAVFFRNEFVGVYNYVGKGNTFGKAEFVFN